MLKCFLTKTKQLKCRKKHPDLGRLGCCIDSLGRKSRRDGRREAEETRVACGELLWVKAMFGCCSRTSPELLPLDTMCLPCSEDHALRNMTSESIHSWEMLPLTKTVTNKGQGLRIQTAKWNKKPSRACIAQTNFFCRCF